MVFVLGAFAGLLHRYQAHAAQWQQVVLVLEYDAAVGATGVVINRPISRGVTAQLGALLTGGKPQLERAIAGRGPVAEAQALAAFVKAFGSGGFARARRVWRFLSFCGC
jgi:hypothetical protein